MKSEKEHAKLVKREKGRVGLFIHIMGLIRNYTPELDKEIRRLLAKMKTLLNGAGSQLFVERLSEFWDMKITFHIDAIWHQIKNRKLTEKERDEFLLATKDIEKLINFAVEEMKSLDCYEHAESFLGEHRLRLHLQTIVSVLEDPLQQDECRFFDERGISEISKIGLIKVLSGKQIGSETRIIPKVPDLDDDDLMGHSLRDAGWVDSWFFGRVVVDGWNLPVIENEKGEISVPIEEMLSEMGGCPFGFVYDNKEWRNSLGYNKFEKTCEHCWKKEYCPGDRCLDARSLEALTERLRIAWEYRDDVQKAIPGFENKLLPKK